MSRLWSSGFELNSTTDGVELITSVAETPEVQSAIVRSGSYAGRTQNTGGLGFAEYFYYQFASSNQTTPLYFRLYLRIATSLSTQSEIIIIQSVNDSYRISIRLNTDNTLELWNEEDSTQIGSDSSALSADTWYRIELKVDTTTISSTDVDAKINGTSFASGTANLAVGIGVITFGIGSATGDLYWDDIAINNSTSSFQNSWPGAGEIIHLRPNAAGDNTGWEPNTGTNFGAVDEVTPDDVTTYVTTTDVNPDILDDYNIDATPVALASDATINVVQVGVRFRGRSTANCDNFALRIRASSGGTVEEGSTIAPANATWRTNAPAAPQNYSLTLYDLPGASTTAWTKADLDTAQIGLHNTTNDDEFTDVSTIWLLVEYTPAVAGGNDLSGVILRNESLRLLKVGK